MIIQGPEGYIYLFLLMMAIIVTTVVIPCYGYVRKGLKGLGVGCAIQPIVAGILCLILCVSAFVRQLNSVNRHHENAMVAVRTIVVEEGDSLVRTWYMCPDEECLSEVRSVDADTTDFEEIKLFDVVPIDSFALCVDDRILVRFNLDSCTAIATDCGQPIDIVFIDWNKVAAYFHEKE